MKPITIADMLALPKMYEIPRDIADEVTFYGPYLQQAYMQAWVNFQYNSYYVANVANVVLWGAVGFIIVCALAIRLFNFTMAGHRLPKPVIRLQTFLIKHLVLSSGIGERSLEPVQWLGRHANWATVQVPLRLHSIIIGIYLVFNFIIVWTPYKALYPSLYWQELGYPLLQYVRFFADRTGIMSFGSTPLVVLLSGRNSPIAFLTGASFSTLQIYHRWVARVTFFQALFHGIAYTIDEFWSSTLDVDYLKSAFDEPNWNWGCVALGGGGLLVVASIRRLREVAYEVFLIGHIVGAILWFVGCWYHVWLLDPKWIVLKWLYASFALWGFDRVARLCRMLFLNLPSLRSSSLSSASVKHLSAEGYLVGTGDFLRLRVTMARGFAGSLGGPGQYVFISSPRHNIWESHPFTITWPTGMPAPSTSASTPSVDDEPKKADFAAAATHTFDSSDVASDRTFELVLKTYGGFTRKLAKGIAQPAASIEAGQAQPVSRFRLLVEGPYGSSVNLQHGYESVFLVAGGSGISATIAHLADLAKHTATLAVKRIVVVWAVRDLGSLEVLVPYLLRLQTLFPRSADPLLLLHLYYTGETHLELAPKHEVTKNSSSASSNLSAIQSLFEPVESRFATVVSHEGRPRISEHIDALQPFAAGKVAVSACGPTGLCDASRIAVRDRMGADGFDADNLVYSEESFTW